MGEAAVGEGCRLGVLAFGDSITNGGGEIQWGVALQSWALWTARALGLGYSPYAVDGATVESVLSFQIPLFRLVTEAPGLAGAAPAVAPPSVPAGARYDLGCLYIGTNDVRLPDWDGAQFSARYGRALDFLAARCDRVVTLTIPLDMGRPRSVARVRAANEAIRAGAVRAGALVVSLDDFGARNLMMADRVHPTAFGQIAIAERVLEALSSQYGMRVAVWPRQLIMFDPSWRERLLGDWAYLYRSLKQIARGSLERRRFERALAQSAR